MKKIICLFFLFPLYLQAQQLPSRKDFPKASQSKKAFSHWVLSPNIFPYLSLFNFQLDENNQKVRVEYDRGFLAGIRTEKYFPNSKKGFGLEFGYFNRDLILIRDSKYFISENAFSLMPFFSLKGNNFEALNHPFFEAGLRNQFTFSSQILQTEGFFLQNPSIIKKYRLWGYLGGGIKRDLFNQDSKRASLSSFGVGVLFPLFNQNALFKQDPKEFSPNTDLFKKNQTYNLFLTLHYAQAINIRKNECNDCNRMPPKLHNRSQSQFLPPLVNWNNPKKSFFGNFFIQIDFQTKLDSVFIETQSSGTDIVNMSHSISNRIGYSFHFLGNYPRYVNEAGEEVFTHADKGLRWDFFLSGGLSDKRVVLGQNTRYRINQMAAEFSGGLRIGYSPPGIFFFAGYTRVVPLHEEFLKEADTINNFNFSNIKNEYGFLGLSFKNGLLIKANYFFLDNLKIQKSFKDNLGFSVGFGI